MLFSLQSPLALLRLNEGGARTLYDSVSITENYRPEFMPITEPVTATLSWLALKIQTVSSGGTVLLGHMTIALNVASVKLLCWYDHR